MTDTKKRFNTILKSSVKDVLRLESAKQNTTQANIIENALRIAYPETMQEILSKYED